MLKRLLRTPAYATYEVELRARFLRPTLLAALVVVVVYLLQGVAGLFRPRLFPWDALLGLLLVAVCGALYRQGQPRHISLAASWLVAGVNILAAFYSQFYGLRHPVTAFYLVGIVLAGMLIGDWFLRIWSALGMLFVGLWAVLELNGTADLAPDPIQSWSELGEMVVLWWGLIVVTAWLVQHFARNLERAVQVSRAQTAALTRTLQALSGEASLDNFLRPALTAIAEQLGAQYATLFLHDRGSDLLSLRLGYIAGRIQDATEIADLAPSPGPAAQFPIWQELIRQREPLLIEDVRNDARLKNRARMVAQGIQSVLYVPLLLEQEVTGFFSINSIEPRSFAAAEIELALALAQQVTLAMQLAQFAEQQEQTAIVAERNRMAREIHDTLAQGFTGILIQLEAAEDALEQEPVAAQAHLTRARALARDSLAEARRSVKALRPQALEGQDLPAALRQMSQRLTEGSCVRATVVVSGEPRPLPKEISGELLRIAQEALTNAIKHSGASAIDLRLTYAPQQLVLEVQDDGQGFSPDSVDGGFGLTSMRERAEQVGGRLTVRSRPGGGTRVVCRVDHEV